MANIIQKHLTEISLNPVLSSEKFRNRILTYFGLGVLGSLLGYILERFILPPNASFLGNGLEKNYTDFIALLSICFFVGIVVILLKPFSSKVLMAIDLTVNLVSLAALTYIFSVSVPGQIWLFPYTFILVGHAVLVGGSLWIQALICLAVLLSVATGQIIPYHHLSETQRLMIPVTFFGGFWKTVAFKFMETSIYAMLSLLIVRYFSLCNKSLTSIQNLGNYLIHGELRKGGMGKLFRASHSYLCRPAAIKVLTFTNEDRETAIARFEREVKLSSSLTHPNTITIFDYGQSQENTFFYAMEMLDGIDLQDLVEQFGPIPPQRAVYILSQICGSLGEAHSRNIVHRDIKPSNIFICCLGGLYDFVKVLDFGLAKEVGNECQDRLTQEGIFLGTPGFTAPELIHHKEPINPCTDIYMLGSLSYWLLTGQPPFKGATDAEIILEHMNSLPKWPSEISPFEIPVELERLIMKCLEKSQELRFQSIAEVAEALYKVPLRENWTQEDAVQWWNQYLPLETEVSATDSNFVTRKIKIPASKIPQSL